MHVFSKIEIKHR